ncbi:phosphoheptose isomerase [Pseudohongiella nitratireducens]|uniref:D-sedoheptulose-7-phosphate isomerase n=1 Tax=Pseudohongiella nitratireducens TaxID=1768907 RepID=A0A916VJU2_9GAMM|nr:D-sedoheptulose 7-phosphate isomerase [Pseudohongiella nitratireducens]GFZ81497.1 phosphoheptose isomerase [Pseudohongiella nitratireducens]
MTEAGMQAQVEQIMRDAQRFLDRFVSDESNLAKVAAAAQLMTGSLEAGHAIYSCGNGGSMSDAMHFAEELTGRYRDNRPGLAATAISDPGHLSCVANDFGYEYVFSRYIEARGRAGDVLLAISTSGSSKNVINACKAARDAGMKVVSLTGAPGSKLGELADVDLAVGESNYADRVQEMHIKVIHSLIELIERHFFAGNYD